MDNNTIRVGFVGAGANTKLQHLPRFKTIEGVEIISVCNRSPKSSQLVADEFDIPKTYDNWTDLVEAPDTNAICIGTWPYMHCPITLAALQNDKHVLTEARMAMNAQEAHTMMNAARSKPNLITQIVPAPITFKVDNMIKELIANGYLGDILSIDINANEGSFIDYEAPLHWRHNRDLSGYNIMQMGIWYETLLRWIGPASSVNAITAVNVKTRQDEANNTHIISIPDHVEVLCETISGPMVHMSFSTVTGFKSPDQVWLFGTNGTLKLDVSTMTLFGGQRNDSDLSEIKIPKNKEGKWRVEEEFVNAIRGLESITHTSFEDGVKYMEFSEAVTRSAQSGTKISLPI